MSAQTLLQAAFKSALESHAPLAEALTGVFDAPPVRAARPFAVIEEAVLADWGSKDLAGREGRVAIAIHDGGERPARLRTLAGAAEDAIEAMPAELGEGWRVVTLRFVRGRIARDGEGRWQAVSEFAVRMLRES